MTGLGTKGLSVRVRRGALALLVGGGVAAQAALGLTASATPMGQTTPEVVLPSPGGVVESAVAVDPRDPRNVVVAAIEMGHQRHVDVLEYGYEPHSVIWRSTDGGRSFARVGELPFFLPPSKSGGNDPTLAWDPHGPLYAGYLDNQTGQGRQDGLWVARSDDAGKTWHGRPAATNVYTATGCTGPDRPTVVVDRKRGTVWAAYQHLTFTQTPCVSPATFEMRVVRSTDGGRTWSTPRKVSTGYMGYDGVPAVLADGNLAVAYFAPSADQAPTSRTCSEAVDVRVAVVTPRLRVVSDRGVIPTICGPVVASQGGVGSLWSTAITPAIAYDERSGKLVIGVTDSQPVPVYRIARVPENGPAVLSTLTSATPGGVYVTGQLAAGAGRVALSVLDSSAAGLYTPTLLWSHDGGATWSTPYAMAPSSQGNVHPWASILDPYGIGHYQGLDVGPDGVAHAAWPDLRPGSTDPEIVHTYCRGVALA